MDQESLTTFAVPNFAFSIPATDRASLEGLSKDEVRAWALRKSEEYRLLSYAMLSLHNAAAPIHSLPVELLMRIFGMTWSREGRLGPISVCRRWHTLYHSTRAFWAEILAELSFVQRDDEKSWTWRLLKAPTPELVTALLEKSAPHPIPLEIVQTLEELEAPPLPPCVFPSVVSLHLHHVVDLKVKTTLLHLHDLYQVLNAGMPTLEVLDIRAHAAEPPNFAHTLASLCPVADESLPRLYRLRLDPAIFFPLIAVRSLKDLYLGALQELNGEMPAPWAHPPGSESRSLLRVLGRCQNLERLILEDFSLSRWWPPIGRGGQGTVQLRSLKTLIFGICTETREPFAHAILTALDPCIPPTATVHLGPIMPGYPDRLSRFMLSYLVQHHPFDSVLLSPLSVGYGTWFVKCFEARSLRLDIMFNSHKTFAELGIEAVFRTAIVTHLEITPDHNRYDFATAAESVQNWAAVLRAFPRVTHLVASGVDAPSGVVDALGADAGHGVIADSDSGPDVLASGSPLPVCRALRCVTLGWEVPREIAPKDPVGRCDAAIYRQHRDVGPRVEHRCSAMQLAFERRASMGAQQLDALEFYEYERQGWGRNGAAVFGELIVSSRRDDNDLPCLARLRTVVGGPVVYRGYLLKMVD